MTITSMACDPQAIANWCMQQHYDYHYQSIALLTLALTAWFCYFTLPLIVIDKSMVNIKEYCLTAAFLFTIGFVIAFILIGKGG